MTSDLALELSKKEFISYDEAQSLAQRPAQGDKEAEKVL